MKLNQYFVEKVLNNFNSTKKNHFILLKDLQIE